MTRYILQTGCLLYAMFFKSIIAYLDCIKCILPIKRDTEYRALKSITMHIMSRKLHLRIVPLDIL